MAAGTTLLNETFRNATTAAPVIPMAYNVPVPGTTFFSAPGLPCLTAGTNTSSTPIRACAAGSEAAGSGVLRLTDENEYESAGIVYGSTFPTSAGLTVTFDQYQYGGGSGGADGITFALMTAPPSASSLGPPGGANSYSVLSSSIAPADEPGVPFGYLGIALDAFGNFTNTVDNGTGGAGCPQVPGQTTTQPSGNQVSVRGSGNGHTGYCLLATSNGAQPDPMTGIPLRSATRTGSAHVVTITINPTTKSYTVQISPKSTGVLQTVLSGSLPATYFDPATGNQVTGLPPRLTFAFTGTTGAGTDMHEISNVVATTINPAPPTLTLASSDSSAHRVTAGQAILYTLSGGVAATSPIMEAQPVTVTDPLPGGETLAGTPTGSGWNCGASVSTQASCTFTGTVAIGATLPTIDVAANVPTNSPASVTNTATISSADAAAVPASDAVTVTPLQVGGGQRQSTTSVLSCTPDQLLLGKDSTCTDLVADTAGTTATPGGTVLFTSPGGTFASPGNCTLSPVAGHPGSASCSITYTAKQPGTDTIGAGYQGDSLHLPSIATTTVASAPVAGKTATVSILSGKILIKLKNSNLYVPLSASGAISIPIGSTIDALNGTVNMTTAADTLSPTNQNHDAGDGAFSEGLFAVKQAARAAQGVPPPVNLVLQTPVGAVAKAKCKRTGPTGHGVVRSLKGVVKGNYVAVGAASSTSMRKGEFVVQDRCDGTLTRVIKGKATVRYRIGLGRHTRVVNRTLRAHQELLAKERFLADTQAAS
jgi:hypothetical protein